LSDGACPAWLSSCLLGAQVLAAVANQTYWQAKPQE
jgi:hypothetical protein